jgi:hypothetical protein
MDWFTHHFNFHADWPNRSALVVFKDKEFTLTQSDRRYTAIRLGSGKGTTNLWTNSLQANIRRLDFLHQEKV